MSFNPLGLTLLNIPPLLRLSLGQSLGAALKNWSLSLSICSLMFSKGSASMLLCITPSLSGCLLLYMDTNAVLNLSPNLWTSLEHSRNSAHHWLTVICTGLCCYEASHWSADTLLHSDWMRDDSFCAEGSLWRHDGNIACARCSKITYFRSKLNMNKTKGQLLDWLTTWFWCFENRDDSFWNALILGRSVECYLWWSKVCEGWSAAVVPISLHKRWH